jgi:hypothetical protein
MGFGFRGQRWQVAVFKIGQGLQGEHDIEARAIDGSGTAKSEGQRQPGLNQGVNVAVILGFRPLVNNVELGSEQICQGR